MERISCYSIPKPELSQNKPVDCRYYAGGSCLAEKEVSTCDDRDCRIYIPENFPPIVTLCGSTRFKKYFLAAARELTLQEWVVLMPGVFGHSDGEPTEEEKQKLDNLHREKIRLSNAVFVLNIGGYIGKSTQKEIEFAKSLNIPVYMYE